MENSFLSKIRSEAQSRMSLWPGEHQKSVYDSLNRGRAILHTQDQLDCYLHSYGKMHYAKLQKAFDGFEEWLSRFQEYEHSRWSQTEIIDYGSGLGIGTIALLEYLYGSLVKADCRITLIDPSSVALERAESYLGDAGALKGPGCIRIINENIDEMGFILTSIDFMSNVTKFHLFSNVLDIEDIDLEALANEIFCTQEGNNYFICVVPSHPSKNKRLDEFIEHLEAEASNLDVNHEYEVVFESDAKVDKWYSYIKVVRISIKPKYDEEGYDEEGFDDQVLPRDRNGYQRTLDEDRYIHKLPLFDQAGYDMDGYDRGGYDEDGYDVFGNPE
jgi:hypothetical protein